MATKQFNYLESWDYDGKKAWTFDCSMICTCEPLFDDCDSNYEVEEKLRKAKVLTGRSDTDTESCALVVRFSSQKSADAFIDRLNKYLVKKAEKLVEATDY
jgi:hypothetical protein